MKTVRHHTIVAFRLHWNVFETGTKWKRFWKRHDLKTAWNVSVSTLENDTIPFRIQREAKYPSEWGNFNKAPKHSSAPEQQENVNCNFIVLCSSFVQAFTLRRRTSGHAVSLSCLSPVRQAAKAMDYKTVSEPCVKKEAPMNLKSRVDDL